MNYLIQAIADGITDAGCTHYANYPGFHANELHAALNSPYTSCDEKNAFAFAWGCSMAGERAVVSFKNVGLNDAADAFLGALFVGCRAGWSWSCSTTAISSIRKAASTCAPTF